MAAAALFTPDQREVYIRAKLFFYGSEATPEVAQAIIDEINRMYNEPAAEVLVEGQICRISFEIDYGLLSMEQASRAIADNADYRNNFIRLEKENVATRSFMGYGLGDNTGHWIVTDQLGHSTTAAHEFGHGLGLDHPTRLDYRGTNAPPPIMAPRGSLVDPKYQWEPDAQPGQRGGTMNPVHRRVSVEEIEMIVANLIFRADGSADLGRLSNVTFDKMGRPGVQA